jgi:ribosomal protein L18E
MYMPPNKSLHWPPGISVMRLAWATRAPDTWRKLAKPLDGSHRRRKYVILSQIWTLFVSSDPL